MTPCIFWMTLVILRTLNCSITTLSVLRTIWHVKLVPLAEYSYENSWDTVRETFHQMSMCLVYIKPNISVQKYRTRVNPFMPCLWPALVWISGTKYGPQELPCMSQINRCKTEFKRKLYSSLNLPIYFLFQVFQETGRISSQ